MSKGCYPQIVQRSFGCLLLPWIFLVPAISAAQASDGNEKPEGDSWAILIGIEKYHRANHLVHTINDVHKLDAVLRDPGQVNPDCILQITDDEKNPRFQPLKASLMSVLPEWMAKPRPNDRMIFYFSGHGFKDANGKLYLAPIDCDPKHPAETGIAVEWVREQFASCRAGFKLLILDACHAGSEKGTEEDNGVSAKDLAEPFRELAGVITLASSKSDEVSQIWKEKEQSLFSYWLVQEGLKVVADKDGDGKDRY